MAKKSWLKNKNSRRWKQLEYILSKLPYDEMFTVAFVREWIAFNWPTLGQTGRYNRPRRLYDFNGHQISRFLKYHEDVEVVGITNFGENIFIRRNKNEKGKTLP